MGPERWQKIDALFEAALERPAGERAGFLNTECGGDGALRAEVESLLAAADKAGGFLQNPAELPTLERPTLGPYRIEREIGRGGMGTVYLAVRDDDAFSKQVAVKILRPGIRSAGLEQRFRSERQILATLEHPAIARLLDGGTTAGGRPYLVMEYVDGVAIDAYCDRHRLSVRRRLEIFGRVCDAVHYAHQNLVVHRDVKPSNILVTADGAPRLLDFGIAKLLDPTAFPDAVDATVTGLRPMTPSYASPEQVRGAAITTASDVYSLGVLLYQLLTGRLPHRLAGLAPLEVDRILTDGEPLRPSVAVTRNETFPRAPREGSDGPGDERQLTLEQVSRERGARPQQLRRQLAGDLDNIVAKALAKQPARRYGSVEQLQEDLRRHRRGLPILARQASLGYAAGKFFRRHRLAVAAVATLCVLVSVFAGAMAHQATQTARQRDRAEQATQFLLELFEVVDPGGQRGDSVTAREILDRGAGRIERELADQPLAQAGLQEAIGAVYLNLGFYDEAAPLLEASLATRERRLAPGHLDVGRSLYLVARLRRFQGRYDQAEPLFLRALELRQGTLEADTPEVAEVLQDLAIVYRNQGRYPEAEDYAQRARAVFESAHGPGSTKVADSLRVLAGVQAFQGHNDAAERSLKTALAVYERVYGDGHTDTGTTHQNLGFIYWAQGDLESSERHHRRAIEIWEKLLGPDHPNVADSLTSLGTLYRIQEYYSEAEVSLRRALEIYEAGLEGDHSDIGNCLYELGHVVLLQERLSEAESLLLRSLAINESALGRDHPWVGESLGGLAELRWRQDRTDDAERLFRRALEIWQEHPNSPNIAGLPQAFAAFLRAQGRDREAAALAARTAAHSGSNASGSPPAE